MIWVDTIIQGILLGGLYALFAAGLSLVFGIMRLVNLAHGDLIVLGAYLILLLVTLAGLSPVCCRGSCHALHVRPGLRIAEIHAQPVLGDDILPPLLVTFGLSVVLQNALLEGFSADSQRIQTGALSTASIEVAGLNLGVMPLMTFGSALAS
jgi:branched-chain amino acid transport system permease protein